MKRGFTLIELSVVLVIIGLLIGAIIAAQSMIEAAKLNSFVQQFQQYDAALINFNGKYNLIPGDARLTSFTVNSSGANPATQDGILSDGDCLNNDTYYDASGSNEYMLYWLELAIMEKAAPDNCGDLADKSPNGSRPAYAGSNCNMPLAKYGSNKKSVITVGPDTIAINAIGRANANNNTYYVMDCSGQSTNAWNCVAPFSHLEALAFDQKIDNGVPDKGIVTAGSKVSLTRLSKNGIVYPSSYDVGSTTKLFITSTFPNGL